MAPSLSITLQTGDFRCFACGAEGSFVDLYSKVTGESMETAEDIIYPVPDYVVRLNQRHAVVSLEGDEVILNEKYVDGKYVGVNFSSPSDFTLRYENQRVRIGKRAFSIAEAWRRHRKRRQFETSYLSQA